MARIDGDNLVLHNDMVSGNCYKIRLTAALVGVPITVVNYDIRRGETRTPGFLATVNADGRIPVLQIGDRFLPESNAACHWLAADSALVPTDRVDHADMLRWMFFEQNSHEPNVATLRFWLAYLGRDNLGAAQLAQVDAKIVAGEAALSTMDRHLATRDWFTAGRPTLADVALFAYTHVAEEGGAFSLGNYPSIQNWIDRVRALPRFVAMAK